MMKIRRNKIQNKFRENKAFKLIIKVLMAKIIKKKTIAFSLSKIKIFRIIIKN